MDRLKNQPYPIGITNYTGSHGAAFTFVPGGETAASYNKRIYLETEFSWTLLKALAKRKIVCDVREEGGGEDWTSEK